MHCPKKGAALAAALALCFSAAAEDDPLADLLHRRGYDRDAILRQFPPDPPPDAATTDSKTDSGIDSGVSSGGELNSGQNSRADSLEDNAPKFLPIAPRTAAAADNIALVLPTLAGGVAGQAAQNFYRGCLHAAGTGGAKINLYAFDGAPEEAVRHYAAASAQGAAVAVGPMLKRNVRALLREYPRASARTLLLQPGGGGGYFVMSLDAAREAADLAILLHEHFGGESLIVEQADARGARLRAAFEERWTAAGGALPRRFVVRDEARDWQRLFDMLKDETADEEEAAPPAALIFAAGDGIFAGKARNFAPQRHPVFAVSTANTGARAESALLLENLGFMEMPWFVGLDEPLSALDSPAARALPFLRQRFFALGADACRAALRSPEWREGWTLRGLAGDWRLQNGVFVRAGRLAAYRAGRLRPL